MRVRWTTDAADDLERICDYLAEDRPESARRGRSPWSSASGRWRRFRTSGALVAFRHARDRVSSPPVRRHLRSSRGTDRRLANPPRSAALAERALGIIMLPRITVTRTWSDNDVAQLSSPLRFATECRSLQTQRRHSAVWFQLAKFWLTTKVSNPFNQPQARRTGPHPGIESPAARAWSNRQPISTIAPARNSALCLDSRGISTSVPGQLRGLVLWASTCVGPQSGSPVGCTEPAEGNGALGSLEDRQYIGATQWVRCCRMCASRHGR